MFKKLTACLLTLVVLLPNILLFNATVAVAASTPEISISNVSGSVGDTVDVPIIISSNPGITALSFSISYDNSMISLIGVSDGGILGTSTPSFGNNYSLIPYTLNWDDLSTTDNYGNGTVATLKFKILESANGTTPISISLNQKSTFNVNLQDVFFSVNNGSISIIPITTTKIEINTVPNKTEYFVNDLLITDGLTLTATYSNGKSETITNGFTCSPTKLSSSGTQTISVNYNNKTTSFTVSVVPLEVTSLSVSQLPEKISYFVGETLNVSGLSLSASYNNGTSKEIANGFTCSPTTLSSVGNQFVTVSYGGKTVQYEIVVSEIILSDITVKNLPTKTEYYVGEKIDPNGLVLTGIYNNGSEKDITNGYTISNSSTVFETPGINTISVYYDGKSVDFNVNVIPVEITEITVINLPAKTDYYVDESFDQTGLKLKVSYSNGTNTILEDGYTFSPNIFTSTGTQKVTIEYSNKTTSFDVNVTKAKAKKILIYNNPQKMDYFVGETFDPTGMTLMVIYDNATTSIISSGFVCKSMQGEYGVYQSLIAFSSSGNNYIRIEYGDLNIKLTVNVESVKLSAIEVINITKPKYYLGESFSKASVDLKKINNDGSYEVDTNPWSCKFTPEVFTETGIIEVTATYVYGSSTFTDVFNVEVIKPPYTYSLTYDPNGGSNGPATQNDSVVYTIPSTIPKYFPNTFEGWSESYNSTTPKYHSGDMIVLDDNLKLYAVWAKPYSSGTQNVTAGCEVYYGKYYNYYEEVYTFSFAEDSVPLSAITIYDKNGNIIDQYTNNNGKLGKEKLVFIAPNNIDFYIGLSALESGKISMNYSSDYLIHSSDVKIHNNPGARTINYREGICLKADLENTHLFPYYGTLNWYVNDKLAKSYSLNDISDSDDCEFTIKEIKGTTVVKLVMLDENGTIIKDENGNDIVCSETINVNAGFFKKLIAFFKGLFGLLPIIKQ